jgi:hypothetical protein
MLESNNKDLFNKGLDLSSCFLESFNSDKFSVEYLLTIDFGLIKISLITLVSWRSIFSFKSSVDS